MAQVPENMDAFNRFSLELFARLYDSFPWPININPSVDSDIAFAAVPRQATDDQIWNISTLGTDVIRWLGEEGFLRYDPDPNHRYGYFGNVRLSLKGLTILGHLPTSLQAAEPKEALISKVKRILASGTATASSESIKLVVSEIFQLPLAPGAMIASQMYA